MAGLCSDSVLTGQEGSIQFKPPGTSVCIHDHTPFGEFDITAAGALGAPAAAGEGNSIELGCGADFRVNDVVVFQEEDGGELDTALQAGTPRFLQAQGAVLTANLDSGGTQYVEGTYEDVPLTGGTGTGATADIIVDASGVVTDFTLTARGSGYTAGDDLSAIDANLGGSGSGSGFSVDVTEVFSSAATGRAYYVVRRATDNTGNLFIAVSLVAGGAPIQMNGDGGTGTENTPDPAHINVELADWYAVCGVREFSLEISRDELDVTTLPCVDPAASTGCDKLASFRSTQAGYANATGSMTVYFTCDQEAIGNRLLSSSLLRDQGGAKVKLYVCTQVVDGAIDDNASLYVEAEINITGMSFSVNPDDATQAELSFSVKKMTSAFGLAN